MNTTPKQPPMSEKIPFRYESIGNILRLLVNIQFENTYDKRDVTIYHAIFDIKPDDIFEQFITKLYPNGCTVGKTEIENVTTQIYHFLQTDAAACDEYMRYDKRKYGSYVCFIPDKKVYYAAHGNHAGLVHTLCLDYFQDFDKIDVEYLRRFILDNFEIKSDNNTTIQAIAADADYIAELIALQ